MFRLAVVGLLIVVLLVLAIVWTIRALIEKSRHKELARYAPGFLQYADVPAPLAELAVEQGKRLRAAADIMQELVTDQEADIPIEYFGAMELWLREERRRLNP